MLHKPDTPAAAGKGDMMIPRPGDLIESNNIGNCNRYRVISAGADFGGNIWLHCHKIYPNDGKDHPRDAEVYINALREDVDLIVGDWYEPWMAYYTALTGPDNTSPRRPEFRIINREPAQLALFGEAA